MRTVALALAAALTAGTTCAQSITYLQAGCVVMGANSEVLDCSGKHTGGGLTSVPTDIPSTVVHVWLSHNQISTITATDFAGLYNMKYLYLDNNLITSVAPTAFSDLRSLVFLLLNNNALTDVADGTFSNQVNLEALDMRANALPLIRPGMFMGLTKLVYLNIYGNSIRRVQCGTFNTILTVGYLNMAENPSVCSVSDPSSGLLTCTCDSQIGNGGFGYCSDEDHALCGAEPPLMAGYANAETTPMPHIGEDGAFIPLNSDRFTTTAPTEGADGGVVAAGNAGGASSTQAQASDNTGVMLAGLVGGMAVLVAAVGVAINVRTQAAAAHHRVHYAGSHSDHGESVGTYISATNIRGRRERKNESHADLQWDDGANIAVAQWAAASVKDDDSSSVSTSIMNRTMDQSKWKGSLWNQEGNSPQDEVRPALSQHTSLSSMV
eukprot:m.141114 g.141114  ORF g.141114 m.141114 type:complete len:437 (-) comp11552_c1_seq2:1432-2742(-)